MEDRVIPIREFIKMDIDIDVCDDYDETCYIAFCGAMALTEEGEKEFADVLDAMVEVSDNIAILHAESCEEVNALRHFFYSAAGYCPEEDYNRWFEN